MASVGSVVKSVFGAAVTTERLLRWSLGIVYVWFGALKLVGMSPVLELVRQAYPVFATFPLYLTLAVGEVALGLVLLIGVWKRWAAAAVVLHLLGTFGVLASSPHVAFLPRFPFLTMEGEFVVKNLVLLAAGAALWLEVSKTRAAPPLPRHRRTWVVLAFLGLVSLVWVASAYLHQSVRVAAQRSAGTITALPTGGAEPLFIEGRVTDRCRLLGCWLKVRDQEGEHFVDLAPAGLSAKAIPTGKKVRITGRIGKTREGSVGFVASDLVVLRKEERDENPHRR